MEKLSKTKRIQIIKDWVKALRQGRYKQTDCELHNEDGYCCLGVLCERNKKIFGLKKGVSDSGVFNYNEEENSLPKNVTSLMGLTDNGVLAKEVELNGSHYSALTELNDNGMSFKQIAGVIEEQILKPLKKR